MLNFNGPLALPFTFVNCRQLDGQCQQRHADVRRQHGRDDQPGQSVGGGRRKRDPDRPATTNSPTTLAVNSLGIAATGVLDVANNEVLINYGSGTDPISTIAGWIASGHAGGAWNGSGIISSVAQTNPSYGLGYADSADKGNPANLPSGQIEILYTLLGDANLDGKVNGMDFNLMAANFDQAVTNGWDRGDFNYDGAVNGSDFVLLAGNFNQAAQIAVAVAMPAVTTTTAAATTVAAPATSTIAASDSNGVVATVLGNQVARRKLRH